MNQFQIKAANAMAAVKDFYNQIIADLAVQCEAQARRIQQLEAQVADLEKSKPVA